MKFRKRAISSTPTAKARNRTLARVIAIASRRRATSASHFTSEIIRIDFRIEKDEEVEVRRRSRGDDWYDCLDCMGSGEVSCSCSYGDEHHARCKDCGGRGMIQIAEPTPSVRLSRWAVIVYEGALPARAPRPDRNRIVFDTYMDAQVAQAAIRDLPVALLRRIWSRSPQDCAAA
jgi:hypothetical protein